MSLNKINYIDQETVITAENLNNIQDNIISNKMEIDNKVDKVEGKGLSTNDYTDEDKALIATIPTDTEQAEIIEFEAYTEDAIQSLWDSVVV